MVIRVRATTGYRLARTGPVVSSSGIVWHVVVVVAVVAVVVVVVVVLAVACRPRPLVLLQLHVMQAQLLVATSVAVAPVMVASHAVGGLLLQFDQLGRGLLPIVVAHVGCHLLLLKMMMMFMLMLMSVVARGVVAALALVLAPLGASVLEPDLLT